MYFLTSILMQCINAWFFIKIAKLPNWDWSFFHVKYFLYQLSIFGNKSSKRSSNGNLVCTDPPILNEVHFSVKHNWIDGLQFRFNAHNQDLINQLLNSFTAMLSRLVYLRLAKTVEIFTLSFFLSTLKYNGLTFCAAPSTQSFIWKGKHYFLISFLFTVYFIEIVSLQMQWKYSSPPQKCAYNTTHQCVINNVQSIFSCVENGPETCNTF